MNLNGKKILFLSAHFFGYERAITKRLQELGAAVDFYNERPSDSVLSKGIIRVKRNFYHKKIKSYYQIILEETKGQHYDFFLLIKGETVPFFFLDQFKKLHPSAVMLNYSYDAVKEYPRFLKLYTYFDKNFTFEPEDAHQYHLHFRPLFFLNDYAENTEETAVKYDVVFIGSAHTDRYLIGEKVRQVCSNKHLKTFFYYYAQSKAVFLLKKIFDKNLQKFDVNKLSFRKLSHADISSIYSKTRSVLDINKPFQDGLTMRTFEALASGKKLITTNSDIRNYPFYDPENIMILNRCNVQMDAEFFRTEFKDIAPETLKMMTLDSWIECLFHSNQDDYWKANHSVFQPL